MTVAAAATENAIDPFHRHRAWPRRRRRREVILLLPALLPIVNGEPVVVDPATQQRDQVLHVARGPKTTTCGGWRFVSMTSPNVAILQCRLPSLDRIYGAKCSSTFCVV